jgi:hypothetical protein
MSARANQVVVRAAVSAALLIAFHTADAKSPNGPPNGFPNIPSLNPGLSNKGSGVPGHGHSNRDFGSSGQGKGGPLDKGPGQGASLDKGNSDKGQPGWADRGPGDKGSSGKGSEGRGDSSGSDKDSPKDNLQASAGGQSAAHKSKPLHVIPTCD